MMKLNSITRIYKMVRQLATYYSTVSVYTFILKSFLLWYNSYYQNTYHTESLDSTDHACLRRVVRLPFFSGWGLSWHHKLVNFVALDNRTYARTLTERMSVKT